MREILFRGKRIDNGEWAYGNFVMDATEQVQRENIPLEPILADGFIRRYDLAQQKIVMHEVDRETIGQYTGLTDKYGKKIFEGDIVKHYNHTDNPEKYEIYRVEFCQRTCKFVGRLNDNWYAQLAQHIEKHYEIIGNIHDNPELLKGE